MNTESQIIEVNIDDIIPNRFQPRIAFDEKGLQELAASIKEHGIIQPLVLRKLGKKYEIIAGERRYKASTLAGLTKVPAIISNIDDNKSAEVALVENIQRRDLTPIEEARSYKNLLDKGYLTQEQLAKKMGLSQSTIANKLRLLNLDETVQQALLEGKISERHARSLLAIPDKEQQKEWLNKIITERMTVRQLDQEIKKQQDSDDENGGSVPLVNLTPNIDEIKEQAQDINEIRTNNQKMEVNMNDYNNIPNQDMTQNNNMMPDTNQTFNAQPNFMNNNTFFNNNINQQQPQQFETLNETIPQENPTPMNNDVEVFDAPTQNMNPIQDGFNNPTQPLESPIDPMTPMTELNPNNKFFQPTNEMAAMTSIDNITIPDNPQPTVNPMDYVDQINQNNSFNQSPVSLPDTINEIRNFITQLQNKGINVRMDEADLETSYQINIIINK